MSYATPKLSGHPPISAPLTRAERETRAVAALMRKKDFAPGLFGYEREQMALMIVRVVLDCEDGKPA